MLSWAAPLLFLIAVAMAMLLPVYQKISAPVKVSSCDAACYPDAASKVRGGVLQVILNNNLLTATYSVPPPMSFTLPGSSGYGTDPVHEVFNPAGGHVPPPPYPFFVTNGNRVDGEGSDAPDMLLVAPMPNAALCLAAAGERSVLIPSQFDITPYGAPLTQKAPLLAKPRACVSFHGRYYFYDMLLPE